MKDYNQSMKDPAKNKNSQWQVNLNLTPAGDNTPAGAFLPKKGKDRPRPHVKINECDH